MITVLMVVHNEYENVKIAVKSFRLFCDTEISFILADNHSTDGLQAWATEQTDLTYIYFDEGRMGYGAVINMVRKELGIDTDLLTMDGHYLLTPKCLSRMLEMLYSENDIGAVGGRYNEAGRNQKFTEDIQSYEKAVEIVNGMAMEGRRTVMLFSGAVLWKREALNKIGEFEESFSRAREVTDDYCLRMVKEDMKLMVCTNALLWKTANRTDDSRCFSLEEYEALNRKWGMRYFAGSYNKSLLWAIEGVERVNGG